jgi:large subunit ribosomal protein L19
LNNRRNGRQKFWIAEANNFTYRNVIIMHFARLQHLYATKKYPVLAIKSGMLLELHEDVGEGDTKRIQKFKWLVIQVKKPSHPDGTFTIRGTIAGVIVEKIFPLSFVKFEKVILLDQFATRRARINYIRDKIGKDAKMKSIITVNLKEKDLLAEARAVFGQEEVAQAPVTESNEETAPVATTTTEQEMTSEVSSHEETPSEAPVEDTAPIEEVKTPEEVTTPTEDGATPEESTAA